MAIATINPATGETLKTFEPLTAAEIEQRLQKAEAAFQALKKTTFAWRAEKMLEAACLLETEKEALGRLATSEMGKTFKAAVEEVAKCALACRYYAENAETFMAPQDIATNASHSYVRYEPIGPVLAVMPWNFPYWQVFRFAAPALMAGNVGLLKHSSNVPQCALAIEDIFRRAGFPEGSFQTLLVGADRVPDLIADRRVKAATLTGSDPAGRSLATEAGKHLKKVVLELGGSDPFIIMPSANLEEAARTAVRARVINNGQSCIAAKRFIVAESIADEFERLFVAGLASLKVGDPFEAATEVGPLATATIRDELHAQVEQAVAAGATLLTGGKKLAGAGNYYAPTVLTNVPKSSPSYYEELFGPVAQVFRVKNIEEAIAVANDSPFGLGSSAWTNDETEKQQFVEGLEAGAVFINGMVASDPRLPFGGVKDSGFGRELSRAGLLEFLNMKTIWIGKFEPEKALPDTE
ncbi:MAG: NAD-dependent succinate-semialdehyde dehydrogenase [Chloroflexi bacterium]|nr:NAD-dependent succinate-semialdehyde dehydrogenase [Chloroflexota bacterium]OJV92763.1 MAG: NADP-dependent succinic semialdehyde dehydrogenase [Chloroflexi bacterium 54-19]